MKQLQCSKGKLIHILSEIVKDINTGLKSELGACEISNRKLCIFTLKRFSSTSKKLPFSLMAKQISLAKRDMWIN